MCAPSHSPRASFSVEQRIVPGRSASDSVLHALRERSAPRQHRAAGRARSPARLVLTPGTVGGGTAASGEAGSPSQRPKAAFVAAATASGRTSPTTRRVAPLGTKTSSCRSTTSSMPIGVTLSTVPSGDRAYGCPDPNAALATSCSIASGSEDSRSSIASSIACRQEACEHASVLRRRPTQACVSRTRVGDEFSNKFRVLTQLHPYLTRPPERTSALL